MSSAVPSLSSEDQFVETNNNGANDSSDEESQPNNEGKHHHAHQPSLVPVGIVSVPTNNKGINNDTTALADSIEKLKIDNSKSGSSAGNSSSSKSAAISYAAERVIGNGSFGVVYQATVIETGETVAIKKVLQDRRFKNRELQIMGVLSHPDVVQLKHCFYSKGDKPDEVYLNLVMEYIPETLHRTVRNHTKANKLIPITYVKVYLYQLLRSVAYIHSVGVTHRNIILTPPSNSSNSALSQSANKHNLF
jgi:hypothetical protein